MVFFSTSSPYNQNSATHDARHEKMSEVEFKDYMGRGARHFLGKAITRLISTRRVPQSQQVETGPA